jgi:hypothetical protein
MGAAAPDTLYRCRRWHLAQRRCGRVGLFVMDRPYLDGTERPQPRRSAVRPAWWDLAFIPAQMSADPRVSAAGGTSLQGILWITLVAGGIPSTACRQVPVTILGSPMPLFFTPDVRGIGTRTSEPSDAGAVVAVITDDRHHWLSIHRPLRLVAARTHGVEETCDGGRVPPRPPREN